jgi:hypothetical protein
MKLILGFVVAVAGVAWSGVAGADHAHAKKEPPTKAQLGEYKKHIKAGWAAQRVSKWADAVVAFEKALVAIEGDPRALTELGYSAMNAGDFAKARKADDQAVQLTVDKKLKAAALYNLGLVDEKSGDKAGALRAYVASLQLRPNKTVEQAVGRLGATPETQPPFCAANEKPCDCITRAAWDDDLDQERSCELVKDAKVPVPGFRVFHISRAYHYEHSDYMLDEANQLVAVVESGFEYHFGRHSDEMTLDSAEVSTIGGHKLLRIQTTDVLSITTVDEKTEDIGMEEEKRTAVTLCEVTGAKVRCPLRDVPILQEHTDDKPTKTVLDLAISKDGVATLRLVKGATDAEIDKLVGPHKLW